MRFNLLPTLRSIALLGSLWFLGGFAWAQGSASQWYFGRNAGLAFSGGNPQAQVNGTLNTLEGCATLCDPSGNLLFYTNGVKVWNRLHQQMPTGDSLMGDPSSTQSALILPWPGQPEQYLIFTADDYPGQQGLRYSVVDMALHNGLGDVVLRNQLLAAGMSERLAAVRHANGRDFWVIGHKLQTRAFYTFKVDSSGPSSSPVISQAGTVDSSGVGVLKASLAGDRLAMAYRDLHQYGLFGFDRQNGTVTHLLTFHDQYYLSYGVEFSPDGSKLYMHASQRDSVAGQSSSPSLLYQADLSAGSAAGIINSSIPVGAIRVRYPGAFQLGPDGKIYIARHDGRFLGVIHQPNSRGPGCLYMDEGLYLRGKKSQFGLPNFVHSEVLPNPSLSFEGLCMGDTTRFQLSHLVAVDSVSWCFGDPASGRKNFAQGMAAGHYFSHPGDFLVEAFVFRGEFADTLRQPLYIGPIPEVNLGPDSSLCAGEALRLNAQHPSTSRLASDFRWGSGEISPILTLEKPGLYWIEVNNRCGSARDSIRISRKLPPLISLGADTTLCANQSLTLSAYSTGATYRWQNGAPTPVFRPQTSGLYHVTVRNRCGSVSDSIHVTFIAPPPVNLGPDTTLCPGQSISLEAVTGGTIDQYLFLWHDGSRNPIWEARQPGTYFVQVFTPYCRAADTIEVQGGRLPYAELGPDDTTLCDGAVLRLHVGQPGATYRWQNNHPGPEFEVWQAGTYNVEVRNACGTASDTVRVQYSQTPFVSLGADSSTCPYNLITLDPRISLPDVTYIWNDGWPAPVRQVSRTGTYIVTLSNFCGSVSDSIHIQSDLDLCGCRLFVPNVFTPNADGVNDHFEVIYPCYFQRYSLAIFDRWGEKLFYSEDPQALWDGTHRQQACPEGIYFYILTYQGHDLAGSFQEGGTLKGAITLLR